MAHAEPGGAGADTGKKPNRLSREKSPYLLQHANNPVDWYPWGEEAFDRARREDKPVFLSIGYATCHWCHVMAHESFEDDEVAELLNRDFVCIKVDREERPDIDSTYMAACQLMTGQGGWPLTIVMTPDRVPFFAATYLPKERRFSMYGLFELLPRIAGAWQSRREELLRSTESILSALGSVPGQSGASDPDASLLDDGYEELVLRFDPEYGGFGDAPKFPTPHVLVFLIRYRDRAKKERALLMALKTLDAMRDGGICDQVGGGFHRYSTDAQWRVPHFEKMLYDQALLLMAYTEAFQLTGEERFRRTAEDIVTYVLRDLRSTEGAFCSAEDADSPGGEGAFYLWTTAELKEVLGAEDGELAARLFSAGGAGNFTGEAGPSNILYRSRTGADIASAIGITLPELADREASIRKRLFGARARRPRPLRDDKVLADWNGLFIAALARAARTFRNPEYRSAAGEAMAFILGRMRTNDGGLFHRYRDGEAAIPGFADDYAFVLLALIELYETTFETRYLADARALAGFFTDRFLDGEAGGFFQTDRDTESLFSRRKEIYDGAVPSSNAVAFEVFLRLSRLTGDPEYERIAAGIGRCFADRVRENPVAHGWFLTAADLALGPSQEIVIAGPAGDPVTERMIAEIRSRYLPRSAVLFRPADPAAAAALADLAPFTRDLAGSDGKATVYICTGHACQRPVTDPAELGRLLDGDGK